MNMIEKCARALFDQEWQGAADDSVWEADRAYWITAAEAVLRTLREPTPEMVEATLPLYSKHNHGDEPYCGEMADYWRAMIDAALSGDREG